MRFTKLKRTGNSTKIRSCLFVALLILFGCSSFIVLRLGGCDDRLTEANRDRVQKNTLAWLASAHQEARRVVKWENDGADDDDESVGRTHKGLQLNTEPHQSKSEKKSMKNFHHELHLILSTMENKTRRKFKKLVLITGTSVFLHRDLELYQEAFIQHGFDVRITKSESIRRYIFANVSFGMESEELTDMLCFDHNPIHCFAFSSLTSGHPRLNRIPNLYAVFIRSDSFCKTVSASMEGSKLLKEYVPECWVFPNEIESAIMYAKIHPSARFVVREVKKYIPTGITVKVDGARLQNLEPKDAAVQMFLDNPMLINGRKWELRTYVLITSALPVRAFIHRRGLILVADMLHDRTHYTCLGARRTRRAPRLWYNETWSFEQLRAYLDSTDALAYDKLFSRVEEAISFVLLAGERSFRYNFDGHGDRVCESCYELLTVSLLVDVDMQPKVIEVTNLPSMYLDEQATDYTNEDHDITIGEPANGQRSNEHHYVTTKRQVMRDMLAMVDSETYIADSLAQKLSHLGAKAASFIQTKDYQYLLAYYRERQVMGGWLPLYPALRNNELHLKFLRSIYAEDALTRGSRVVLHKILLALEGLVQPCNSSPLSMLRMQ